MALACQTGALDGDTVITKDQLRQILDLRVLEVLHLVDFWVLFLISLSSNFLTSCLSHINCSKLKPHFLVPS